MAKSSISVPIGQEIKKLEESNSRRNSTGIIFPSNSDEKGPHYLRASTGSCHEYCKYGGNHALEVKERRPKRVVPRRPLSKSLDSLNSAEGVVFPERKNMSVMKLNESPDSKTILPDTCNNNKQKLPKRSAISKIAGGSELLFERKPALVKFKSSSGVKPHVSAAPKTLRKEVSSSPDKLDGSVKKGLTKHKEKALSTNPVISSKPKSLLKKQLSAPDTSGGSNSSKGLRNINLKLGQRTVASLTPKASAVKQISSAEFSGGANGHRNSDVKAGKRAGMPLVTSKKVSVPPVVSLPPKSSLKQVASLKVQRNRNVKFESPLKKQNEIGKAKPKQPDNDETPEKTLYIIKIETENKPLESILNSEGPSPPSSSTSSPKSLSLPVTLSVSSHEADDQESEYAMTETEEDSFTDDNEEDAETLDEDYQGKPKQSGMVCSEDVDSHPLKFRRGKVVDMQSDNDRARRLKFRRGKVLVDECVEADVQRPKFQKREGTDGNAIGTEPSAEKVVLRHQDVQGKKDDKGLFNNVIEETASKLVEARKSKVKALVGAFDTVISLQERKPSANCLLTREA